MNGSRRISTISPWYLHDSVADCRLWLLMTLLVRVRRRLRIDAINAPYTYAAMPRFKRTRSKVDETDSESGSGPPTIGKRSSKRNKPVGNAPNPHHTSPQKLMAIYIVAAKLGTDRTVAGLSDLIKGNVDYTLAKHAEEADVIVTGIGMRRRLERSIPAELIVSYPYSIPHLTGLRQPAFT